ncbi:hypothetical protein VTN77DRAFT_1089 [Rasamsonia byssochlamydoides]|uniref:uncharacterized protein n=1 Tax=Rasamsonia byssochlamydoides TaxID=89139 RepID=UPI003743F550
MDSVGLLRTFVAMRRSQNPLAVEHRQHSGQLDTTKVGVKIGRVMVRSSSSLSLGLSFAEGVKVIWPEDIPIGAYTHLNFAFAYVNPSTFAVAPMSADQVALYSRTTALKQLNPGMEVWISIGGWSMNDADQPTATTFSNLAASTSAQSAFFASLLSFLETYGFDGADIDWEYPVAPDRSGSPADFANYVTFLQNLKLAMGASGHKYGLSITLPSSYWYLQNFDIVNIAKVVDWFNMMTYDLHGTWDSSDQFIGPYVYAHTNLTEIDQAMQLLWRNNIDPGQVNLGLGFYGRSYTLADPSCTVAGCEFSGGGNAGACTQSVGTLSYAEIQSVLETGAVATLDADAAVKQIVFDTNQLVSYDDAYTLGLKLDYANKHCLGGTMVWAVSLDTKNGSAAMALSEGTDEYPGTSQIKRANTPNPPVFDASGQCFITDCYDKPTCPSGWGAVQRTNGNKQDVDITHGCSGKQKRTYCCPENDMPSCHWIGSAPFCSGGCSDSETRPLVKCSDMGRNCAAVFRRQFLSGRQAGGDCKEYQRRQPATLWLWDPPPGNWVYCNGKCPVGKTLVATDSYCLLGGTRALCCDPPSTYNDAALTDFKNKLEEFMNPLSCSTSEVGPSKRDFSSAGGYSLMETIAGFLSANTYTAELEREAFNNIFWSSEVLGWAELDSIVSAMCQGSTAYSTMVDLASNSYDLCVLPPRSSSKHRHRRHYGSFTGSKHARKHASLDTTSENPVVKRIFDVGNGLYTNPTAAHPRPYTGA